MSDERLDALGLPRREFLKRAVLGAGVFVAPVVVSFGLSGTAEASSCFPNQSVANQFEVFSDLCIQIWTAEKQGRVDHDYAGQIRRKFLEGEWFVLDGNLAKSCDRLDEIIDSLEKQAGKRIYPSTAFTVRAAAQNLWTHLGCAACN